MTLMQKYLFIPLCLVILFSNCIHAFGQQSPDNIPFINLTEREKSWLEAHPDITFCFTLDFEPSLMRDESGTYSGHLWDFLKLLNARSGANIQLEVFETRKAIEKLHTKEIDGLLVAQPEGARKLGLSQSATYFSALNTIFTKSTIASEIIGYESLNNRKVAVIKESPAPLVLLQKNATKAEIVLVKDTATAMKFVFEGKVDAYLGYSVHNYLIGKYMLTGVEPAFIDMENPQPFVYGIRPDWPELVSILNKATSTFTQEERINILEKWSKMDLDMSGSHIDLSESEKSWLKANPTIRLGFNPDMQPLLIQDTDGQKTGIMPDIFKQLEKITGINVKMEVGPWHEITKQAELGQIDGILLCVPNMAKAKGLIPTKEYITAIPVVFGKSNAPFAIKSIDDLKGKRVAYMRGVELVENTLDSMGNRTTTIASDSIMDAMIMVLEGKADVVLGMNYDTYLLSQSVLSGIEPLLIDNSRAVKAITAVRPDWPELTSILNKALVVIGDANINKIIGKWTQVDIPVKKTPLTESERAWLAKHPVIRVVLDPSWAPVEFMDKKGNYHGISMRYLKRLEELTGIRFDIAEGLAWQEAMIGVKSKNQDMFASVAKTPEREKFALFTHPYISMPINIFARDEVSYIGNLNALKGKKVALVEGYAIHEWLRNNHPEIKLVPAPSIPDALKLVVSGDVTAFVGNVVTATYYIGKLHLNNIRVAGETPYANDQCMAVRNDWPELVAILQKALDAIPEHERNSMYSSWMSIKYEHAFDYSLLWKLGFVVGVVFILVIARHLQIRKRAEKTLRESETRYRTLFNSAGDGIAIIKDGVHIECNAKLAEFFGCPTDQIIGQSPAKFSPRTQPDGRDSNKKALEKINKALQGETQFFEWQHKRSDGTVYDAEVTLNCLEIGSEMYMQAATRDITERKQAEKAMIAERDRSQKYLDVAGVMFVGLDKDQKVVLINRKGCDVLGYAEDDIVGKNWFDHFLPQENIPEVKGVFDQIISGNLEPVEYFENPILTQDGSEKLMAWHNSVLRDESGHIIGLLSSGEDITDKKNLEAQLQQSQKIESIGTLAGGIAHDFNNILTPIIVQSELALMDLDEKSPIRFNLEEVMNAGFRAKDLVKQILTFSRQTEKQIVPLKITPIIKEVSKLLRASLPSTIEIGLNLKEGNDTITADPTQVHQVLMNLCTNAGHAMRENGGILKVGLIDVELDSDVKIHQTDLDPGPYLKLTVSDTGHGIPPEAMDRIFDPFFTTKERAEGTGMGLAVVHGIISSYGGAITVESEQDKGTTFNVFLPRTKSKIREQTERFKQIPTGSEEVLIVDDEIAMANTIERMLNRLGYKVTSRTSSLEALELFRNKPDQFDLVITDMTMPQMTGDKLSTALMEIRSDIPIILCTGFSEHTSEVMARRIGIKAFVMKPIVMREIATTIRGVLDKK